MCFLLFVLLLKQAVSTLESGDLLIEQDDLSSCRKDLGMNSGEIPDSAITASSAYDKKSVGPLNSRIRTEKNGGAWCPRYQVSRNFSEWLEIDLGALNVLTLVETQGRFGNGQGQEFAPSYRLEYQREGDGRWIRYRYYNDVEIFAGNSNTYISELRELHPPVVVRRVRFVPYSSQPRTVCMRVELYGCPWTDGIVSYSMRQGDSQGFDMNFYDYSYDGFVVNGQLSGGLGQLTDLQEGSTYLEQDLQDFGRKTGRWVAWKNETPSTEPVEIVFEFDVVRNFSTVNIIVNNAFSRDMSVFREARVFFSVGGKYYNPEAISYQYLKDVTFEFARTVTIPLNDQVGRFVKLVFFFDATWIMISEVRFVGAPVSGTFADELPPDELPPDDQLVLFTTSSFNANKSMPSNSIEFHRRKPIQPPTTVSTNSVGDMELTADSVVEVELQNSDDVRNIYMGVIMAVLATMIIIFLSVGLFIFVRYQCSVYDEAESPSKFVFVREPMNYDLNDLALSLPNGKIVNNKVLSLTSDGGTVSRDPMVVLTSSEKQLKKFEEEEEGSFQETESQWCETNNSLGSFSSTEFNRYTSPPTNSVSHSALRPTSSVGNAQDLHRSVHSPMRFFVPTAINNSSGHFHPDQDRTMSTMVRDHQPACPIFPAERLKFLKKLGIGIFGEINLYELKPGISIEPNGLVGSCLPGTLSKRSENVANDGAVVAVKSLFKDATEQTRFKFMKEIETMSSLQDPNINQVLGLCTTDRGTIGAVLEYTTLDDLHQFLRQHSSDDHASLMKRNLQLSYGCLIYMATQIASGMKFLETMNVVHRDLAARNCLVGPQFTVKISDFGMSRSLYSADYYRPEGKALLPIRWMAWDSVLLRRFSSKSDIWSFAVTVWEVLTFAYEQPFASLDDNQVLDNLIQHSQKTGSELYLDRPPNCPREIYDLMMECWNREESKRPTFHEIHMFLQRKNLGFNPREDSYVLEASRGSRQSVDSNGSWL